MQTTLRIFLSVAFIAILMSCQSKKQELVDKLSIVACQDTKDMIDNHANTLVPFLGKMLLDLAVKEEFKNNVMCDCLTPFIKNYLNENYQEAELDNMLIDKGLRGKAIKKALAQNSTNIFQCYEKKGLKSLKLLKNFIEKAIH